MNLTTVSKYTRIGVIAFGVLVVVYYLTVFVFFPIGKRIYRQIFPPANPPTLAFGKLDPIKFSSKEIIGDSPSVTLNTKTGGLPNNFPDRLTVYKFSELPFEYQAGQTASADARVFGYSDANLATDLKGDVFRWLIPESGSNLTINIYKKDLIHFVVADDLEVISEKLKPGSIDQSSAIQKFRSQLVKVNRYRDGLYDNGTQMAVLGRFRGQRIIETTSTFDSQVAKVDFFRSINNYPIYGPEYKKGLLSAVIGEPQSGIGADYLHFMKVEVYYHPIDTNSNATYPTLPIEDAWALIRKNEGFIADVTPKNSSAFQEYVPQMIERVLINNIKIAYFETPEKQKYLQPIYVFEGNYTTATGTGGTIVIYYPALESSSYTTGQAVLGESTNQ